MAAPAGLKCGCGFVSWFLDLWGACLVSRIPRLAHGVSGYVFTGVAFYCQINYCQPDLHQCKIV